MPRKFKNARIIGIDPGYDRLGVAVIEKSLNENKVIFSDCLISNRKETLAERITYLGEEISKIIKKYKPTVLAIEKIFFNENQKTALAVAELRGAIVYEGAKNGVKIFEYTPLEIKVAVTGYGRADKKQMISLIPRLVKLPNKPKRLDDEFDAIATAITCLAREKLSYPHH
ncbi:MAG: crossover junction endodeoxyribonuclease RuvC [Candidatus Zambryskibacteria bacterium RIFCSPHIGHO2_01_FULL_43_25]|uniref:Crossover junction endodeoxyribonuclease RuvC n=1 Tax=Candidatus Zambryskibacteria bacterium RIFCSPLOWO2_01_FULL_45_21 TaxID=1802761 RepID=A0A1G2U632_9BACT|nr:MAG: crossover junction endodeoxyribonuclease RuvC [Candidatus Zambryskibacteria bacterium RIFCSPHIGHO2_01_FULL_43_25]OHB00746.1 MAG: crossover junction endodeoxyribonuclease RuvC [Candidatus Zambryskibacteria bacterium RIFCSPHIGHO2_12_FULL_44_12b]OHB04342.1 MAG: crossover junction endodeoxyribonuclease RuvC [Candidatus Zambryskibacteria bacterium RIFCSPLOWO2_01_FULL_45_21]